LTSEQRRPVVAFLGMASDAFAAAVPQGWPWGMRQISSSAMMGEGFL